jgi:integrase
MSTSVNISRRERLRTLRDGSAVTQTRYVVSYREPRTTKRRQLFFERAKDAQAMRNEIVAAIAAGTHASANGRTVTVADVVERWLVDREGQVKSTTLEGYRRSSFVIIGPLLAGTSRERAALTKSGKTPPAARSIPMLGNVKVRDLTTGDIRAWHRTVVKEVGWHSANRAKMFLAAALALAAEDLNIRPPAMPRNLGRGRQKQKKVILKPEQIAELLTLARSDRERGVYVAFPFLAGTRPSEQLGLLWQDVDFDNNLIRICRMQERDGTLVDFTRTEAGTRDIPMCPLLRTMLMEWRLACPRREGELHRVFPGPGTARAWPLPRVGGGGPLLYENFLKRTWRGFFRRTGLPAVTPHSARHSFISTMQAQGIEVALVAKLAGHANATITLSHYTQAVRGGEGAVAALERAFTA